MRFCTFEVTICFFFVILFVGVNCEKPNLIQTTPVYAFNDLHRTFGIEKFILLIPQDCIQCQPLKQDIFTIINDMKLAKRINIYVAQTAPGSNLQIRYYNSKGILKMSLSGAQSIKDLKFFLNESLGRSNPHIQESLENGFMVKSLVNGEKLMKEYDRKLESKRILKLQSQKLSEQLKKEQLIPTPQINVEEKIDNNIQIQPQQPQQTLKPAQAQAPLAETGTSMTSQAIASLKNTLNNINTQNLKKQALQLQNKTKQMAATLAGKKTDYFPMIGLGIVVIGWLIYKLTKKEDHFMSIPNSQQFESCQKIQAGQI